MKANLNKNTILINIFIVLKKDIKSQIIHTLLNINKSWTDLEIQSQQ